MDAHGSAPHPPDTDVGIVRTGLHGPGQSISAAFVILVFLLVPGVIFSHAGADAAVEIPVTLQHHGDLHQISYLVLGIILGKGKLKGILFRICGQLTDHGGFHFLYCHVYGDDSHRCAVCKPQIQLGIVHTGRYCPCDGSLTGLEFKFLLLPFVVGSHADAYTAVKHGSALHFYGERNFVAYLIFRIIIGKIELKAVSLREL